MCVTLFGPCHLCVRFQLICLPCVLPTRSFPHSVPRLVGALVLLLLPSSSLLLPFLSLSSSRSPCVLLLSVTGAGPPPSLCDLCGPLDSTANVRSEWAQQLCLNSQYPNQWPRLDVNCQCPTSVRGAVPQLLISDTISCKIRKSMPA